jgi:hypothetical protein
MPEEGGGDVHHQAATAKARSPAPVPGARVTAPEPYPASLVNPLRRRATAAEMETRAAFLIPYAIEHGPGTVRGLYYQAEVHSVPGIGKDENGYSKVQHQVLQLRRGGRLPYRFVADLTRWMRKPRSYDSVEEALRSTAETYRKALWSSADEFVEVWCEKDALAGVIYPITALYDVPLMVARGFSSETFCFEAVEAREDDPRPYVVYSVFDCDRAGRDSARTLKEKLGRFAAEKGVDVEFIHLAIEEDDVEQFDENNNRALVYLHNVGRRWLPTREPKRKTAADRNWPHPFAIELDAIAPDDLRAMVRAAIEQSLPADQLEVLKVAEQSERELIAGLVGKITDGDDGS